MKFVYWLYYKTFRFYFLLFYHLKVYGEENLPAGPAILAPNHNSYLDPPTVGASCPEELHYLARDSLFRYPIFGSLISALNAYPVKGTVHDLSSFKIISQLLQSGKKVVVFPEGIRSETGSLSHIKPGVVMIAMRHQCPIIPIYLHGTYQAWPRTRRFPRPWGRIACIFGKPIYPEQFQNLEKKQAQLQMAKALQESILGLQSSYEEKTEKQKNRKASL